MTGAAAQRVSGAQSGGGLMEQPEGGSGNADSGRLNPRARLMGMRAELLAAVMAADRVELGIIALLANVDHAIEAINRLPSDVSPAARAVLGDDGREIRLTLYRQNGEAAAMVDLAPVAALALAGQLLDAARRRAD